jgi:Poly(ADP-ribose) polymerase catalytic domain
VLGFLRSLLHPPSPNQPTAPRRRGRKWRRRKKAHAPPPFHKKRRNLPRQTMNSRPQRKGWFFSPSKPPAAHGSPLRRGEMLAWHGTQSLANVKSILTHGWVVGTGNAIGDGVYATTDISVAKSYAGSAGYVLKLAIKTGRVAAWSTSLQTNFTNWCTRQQCSADMSAKTAFLLSQGFNTLHEGNIVVVLLRAYRNPLAAKIRTHRVRVISAVPTGGGKEIDVRSLIRS